MPSRYFTIERSSINIKGGRYKADAPREAAKKAAARLFKEAKTKTQLTFCLRETTKGSKQKEYHYTGKKVYEKKSKTEFKISVVSRKKYVKNSGGSTIDENLAKYKQEMQKIQEKNPRESPVIRDYVPPSDFPDIPLNEDDDIGRYKNMLHSQHNKYSNHSSSRER